MNKKEVEKIEEDMQWWEVVGNLLGYKLYGITERHRASFIRDDTRKTILQLSNQDALRIRKLAGLKDD